MHYLNVLVSCPRGSVSLHASYMTASQQGCHLQFTHDFITTLHKGACMYSKIKPWTSACFINIPPGTLEEGR